MVAIGFGWQAEGGEGADFGARLRMATGLEGHGRAKAEADGDEGKLVFVFKPVEGGEGVGCFCTAVVSTLAEAGAAKIETKDREDQAPLGVVEGLHGVVDDLVVHGAAARGVGMADEGGKESVRSALIEESFRRPAGPGMWRLRS